MVDKLVENLYDRELDDFWYDVQMDVVMDVLNQFSNEDFTKLISQLPFNNEFKNQSLIESLSSCDNENAIACADKIISSGKCEIQTLRMCVWALGDKKISILHEQSKQELIKKYIEISKAPNKKYGEMLGNILKIIL